MTNRGLEGIDNITKITGTVGQLLLTPDSSYEMSSMQPCCFLFERGAVIVSA